MKTTGDAPAVFVIDVAVGLSGVIDGLTVELVRERGFPSCRCRYYRCRSIHSAFPGLIRFRRMETPESARRSRWC